MFTSDDFVAIAAIDNESVLEACLCLSPDIASGRLPLVTIKGAVSMSSAYNCGLDRTDARICLFVHQDVYLPRGWLDRAVDCLNRLTDVHPDWMVAGPYGVRPDGVHVGRVWDVTMGTELGTPGFAPAAVDSFDELLLILRRREGFRFDEALPHFHLYGTDLVQTARDMGGGSWAIELPVVHNNRPIASLGGGYLKAYRYARHKWRDRLPIQTTICALSRSPVPLWRARWRRRHTSERPDTLGADAVQVARTAGYEQA
ncbi:glycosyltransferase [Novosphingobium sp. ZN18A2]|uniref:glycosyltransferase n=1 Tax=Novosphingobium sp. ZN18A2 TaxID=3079861 RepID=UPI0030CDB356